MKYIISNLFGTRKLILNEKEAKQYTKGIAKANRDFWEYQRKSLPSYWNTIIVSGTISTIMVGISYIIYI